MSSDFLRSSPFDFDVDAIFVGYADLPLIFTISSHFHGFWAVLNFLFCRFQQFLRFFLVKRSVLGILDFICFVPFFTFWFSTPFFSWLWIACSNSFFPTQIHAQLHTNANAKRTRGTSVSRNSVGKIGYWSWLVCFFSRKKLSPPQNQIDRLRLRCYHWWWWIVCFFWKEGLEPTLFVGIWVTDYSSLPWNMDRRRPIAAFKFLTLFYSSQYIGI